MSNKVSLITSVVARTVRTRDQIDHNNMTEKGLYTLRCLIDDASGAIGSVCVGKLQSRSLSEKELQINTTDRGYE